MSARSLLWAAMVVLFAAYAQASSIKGVEYSPDGKGIAVAIYNDSNDTSTLALIDAATYEPVVEITLPREVFGITFSPTGQFLATVRNIMKNKHAVEIWKTKNWTQHRALETFNVSKVTTDSVVEFVGKKKLLAIASQPRPLVWDFRREQPQIRKIKPKFAKGIFAVTAPTEGREIAFGEGYQTHIYDTKRQLITKSFGRRVASISYGKNNNLIAGTKLNSGGKLGV